MEPSSEIPQVGPIGVVGAGMMGAGIAGEAARSGIQTVLCDIDELALERAREGVARLADKALLETSTDLGALASCEFVVEAVPEDRELKTSVLGEIGKRLAENQAAVIATNTSSIPIAELAMASGRPDRFLGMHFFSPVSTMRLIEMIPTPATTPATIEVARQVADVLGKRVVASPDEAGFIVNRLLVPYLLSAIRLLERGQVTAEDVDAAMELGCGHPMGPLRLADFIGLDVVEAIALELYRATGAEADRPPNLLVECVAGGRLGRKSGSGIYDY